MRFVSTRGGAPPVAFSEAILRGLAPDGGLYVPQTWPAPEVDALDAEATLPALAVEILRPFLQGDELEPELESICARAFDFPMPLEHLERRTSVLELFHGPTAAFKDFGARFLATCFETLLARRDERLTVMVATSGDTGAAVAAACHRRVGMRVGILFPNGGVAPRQERQLTCWDDNVRSFAVRGTFDDCQRLVKASFGRDDWPAEGRLSSANSINVGRLLPQASYYAVTSLRYRHQRGVPAGFIVPSGNVGNAVGAFWARRMGFPLREIAMAANANRVVPDWFETAEWRPRPSMRTLANAMDVGDPSNMERLFHLYPAREELLQDARSMTVDDETIRAVIAAGPERWGRVWCPHTATAVHFREQLDSNDWVVVATAHPAKFDSIVEPLIERPVEVPPRLAALLERPPRVEKIEADLDGLISRMDASC
jgi:threonine synthase